MLRLTDFIIDCPETMKLAAFYSEMTGRPVKAGSHENWAGIQLGEIELAFIRVEDYRAPQWPDSEYPKQFHLDFEVDDVDAEQTRILALGATLQQDSIGADGYGWRVYSDPVGHPFCLCRNKGAIWTGQGLTWSGELRAPQSAAGEAKVITLCGSTRFEAEFAEVNQRLTMEGCVVISLGIFSLPDLPDYDWTADSSDLQGRLGGVHFHKIRMADEVYVVDPGGYVGESTRREIAYAESLGKGVRYLSRERSARTGDGPQE